MKNKIYVGNLSLDSTKEDLEQFFSSAGTVKEVLIIQDRDTGRSKGFGFVTFATRQEANNAVETLNGHELQSRSLKVSMAKEKSPAGGGGHFGHFNKGNSRHRY
ncbi:MAG: RNA-binding protein [Firmicutes bacterium]|jgi:RNA recognition motif-containing protein|nr:RNA-binding protein [Bacillota bacterium]